MKASAAGARQWATGALLRPDRLPETGLLAAFLALVVALVLTEPAFRSHGNVLLILDQSASVLIVAVPFAMLLIARHIDLSVGSSIAACGVVGGNLLAGGTNTLVACLVVMLMAGGIGAINGVLATYLEFSPIVVTLGMLGLLRGVAFVAQGGQFTAGFSHAFSYLGQGRFHGGDVPIKVVIAAAVLLAGSLFLYRTRKGRHVMAVGANPRASFLAGIHVNRTCMALYVATGLAVGLTALITISELDSAPADIADGFEISVLTAVLLGGVAFAGGRGSMGGVLLGVVFIQTLSNGFTFWGFSTDEVRLANGAVLVVAAGLQALAQWLGRHSGTRVAPRGRSSGPARGPDPTEAPA